MLSKKAKLTNEKIFDLGEYVIKCWVYDAPSSWGHYAELYKNGSYINDFKVTYYNRTWESYCYESLIHKVLEEHSIIDLLPLADEIGQGNVKKELKNLSGLVKLAGIIGTPDTQVKTLETLTGGAVDKPEEWDTLGEEEKKKRLEGAINILG